ncbi:PIKK family atypical protein kinase [Histomonas meleagridis]|nr:PIKK family atypical protein kinase [Histomonas meleagridis]
MNDITEFNLCDASPLLESLNNTNLTVPGTKNNIYINSFINNIHIINSKQKPRKLSVIGSDGKIYPFLLKANEDTRLDERVMQLFNYISDLVHNSSIPLSSKLGITTYGVVPITRKVGLIGWVQDTQTLFEIISNFRNSHGIVLDYEVRKSLKVCPSYDTASIDKKKKAFLYGIGRTDGNDLKKILLKFSTDSNDWLDRRVQFTTSLAVTSMAGYILGLGDRHMCNIMITNRTAKLVHIDFGDCFEVAMHRARFPEKVPFRLTRMMQNALEVSKIEGTLRKCCEKIMKLLRRNGEQILALLEAFINDPQLQLKNPFDKGFTAKSVLERIQDKLTGRDFGRDKVLPVKKQVNLLINQAISYDNLCQMFKGWCPWW